MNIDELNTKLDQILEKINNGELADSLRGIPLYHTEITLNGTYTAYHQFFVIPKSRLESLSFTFVGDSYNGNAENNDTVAYNLACAFIGSAISIEQLTLNGTIFIVPNRDLGSHKVKSVLYKSGSYSFDDFSDCLDYITFGLGNWNTTTCYRYHLDDINIKLKE